MESTYLRQYSFPGCIEPASTRAPWRSLLTHSGFGCWVWHLDSSDVGTHYIKPREELSLVPEKKCLVSRRWAMKWAYSRFLYVKALSRWRRSADNVIRLGPHNMKEMVEYTVGIETPIESECWGQVQLNSQSPRDCWILFFKVIVSWPRWTSEIRELFPPPFPRGISDTTWYFEYEHSSHWRFRSVCIELFTPFQTYRVTPIENV